MRALPFVLAALAATPAFAQSRKLSVDDAVKLALDTNPRLLAARARTHVGFDQAKSARGHILPSVHLSEEYQHWDSPFSISFQFPGLPMLPPFLARQQDTNSFVASADQPIVQLWRIIEDYRSAKLNAEAGEQQLKAFEANVREGVQRGYLQFFEARALEQIAVSSETELNEQVTVAQARLKAGVITNADLLRVQVAAANAKQQQIVAHVQGDVARALILTALGFAPDDPSLELLEPTSLLVSAQETLPTARDAIDSAATHRPEVAQARLVEESADHHRRSRWLALLPDVDFEGAYVRTDGQVFAPTDSAFVGVRASWAIWEWGATFYQARAAKHQAEAAAQDLEQQRRDVSVEAHNDWAQSVAAAAAVDVAQKTIASAEEAYRVTNALVQAGTATTTDLLDAQSALTGARLNLTRAQYTQAIARIALARAMGNY